MKKKLIFYPTVIDLNKFSLTIKNSDYHLLRLVIKKKCHYFSQVEHVEPLSWWNDNYKSSCAGNEMGLLLMLIRARWRPCRPSCSAVAEKPETSCWRRSQTSEAQTFHSAKLVTQFKFGWCLCTSVGTNWTWTPLHQGEQFGWLNYKYNNQPNPFRALAAVTPRPCRDGRLCLCPTVAHTTLGGTPLIKMSFVNVSWQAQTFSGKQ